jgi:hypothetical protein
MRGQFRTLTQISSIAAGLISFNFNYHARASNWRMISPVIFDGETLSQQLPEIADNYTSLSSMLLSFDLNVTEQIAATEENKADKLLFFEPNVVQLLPSDYLELVSGDLTQSTFDLSQGIELTSGEEKQELSPLNLWGYIVSSLKKLTIALPPNRKRVAEVPILPQVETQDIFKGIYDFDITIEKKEYDLHTSLNLILNNQAVKDGDRLANTKANLLEDRIFSAPRNGNPYVSLQQQLVNSLKGNQPLSSPRGLPSYGYVGIEGSIVAPSRNRWVQDLEKAQQDYNSPRLINISPQSYIKSF